MKPSGARPMPDKCRRFMLLGALAWLTPGAWAAEPLDLDSHRGKALDLDQALDLDSHRGKVVIVDFWASWCAPCRQSFPWLNEMQAKYRDRGLVVIGVNVDRARDEAEHFLAQTPADFQIVYDPDGALATRYQVPGMPTSYVIGRDGQQLAVHIGFRKGTREQREAELLQLLSSAGSDRAHDQ